MPPPAEHTWGSSLLVGVVGGPFLHRAVDYGAADLAKVSALVAAIPAELTNLAAGGG